MPESLIFDNATYFSSIKLTEYALEKGIKLKYSANYYPQGNGLAESSNKNMIKILKRTVANHHRDWHTALSSALWADRVTPKAAIGNSPFFLVYGKEAILPPHLFLPSLQLAQSVQEVPCSAMEHRINTLQKLEEDREMARKKFEKHQQTVKRWFDLRKSVSRDLEVGDLVLRWDKEHEDKGKHTKFQRLWLGPFIITENLGPSTFRLQTLEGEIDDLPVNGHLIKRYFC